MMSEAGLLSLILHIGKATLYFTINLFVSKPENCTLH